MKRTFILKSFGARSFLSAALAGPARIKIFQLERTATFVTGATAGQHFHTGAKIGQHYHTGATAGTSHG
jgi:hypothetical protein